MAAATEGRRDELGVACCGVGWVGVRLVVVVVSCGEGVDVDDVGRERVGGSTHQGQVDSELEGHGYHEHAHDQALLERRLDLVDFVLVVRGLLVLSLGLTTEGHLWWGNPHVAHVLLGLYNLASGWRGGVGVGVAHGMSGAGHRKRPAACHWAHV
jgi:hypothetical protein